MRLCALLLLLPWMASAQNEAALERFFVGKRVRVKMDLPATHEGVDYHFGKEPALDFKGYSGRIRKYGVSLRSGDEVTITRVKVKDKNIEFHLGGGGYGVFGDDSGYVAPRSVPKSEREKQLEKDIARETDRGRRDSMQRELDRVRDRRQREERDERSRAQHATSIRKEEVAMKRMQAGSRFNIWIPESRMKESIPNPDDVMWMLGEWLDFGGMAQPR